MKLIKLIIIILTLLTSAHIHGQDTISVYFELGHSKIPDDELSSLYTILTKFDLSDLDSVHFIGMTDSLGDFKTNLKLSEKRAKYVAKNCERLIPANIKSKITALGEMKSFEREKNRRVDIVLFFQITQTEFAEITENRLTTEACYNIDYKLLHRSHFRTLLKAKKEFVIIETTIPNPSNKYEHYYGSTTSAGDFIAKEVKWASRNTGNLWWSKSRYVTTIPKNDFDTYKIFKIQVLPCDTCGESFQKKVGISKEADCIQVDRFLMNNIQFKTRFFNNKWVNIRAPKEYVNIDDKYYISCSFKNELIWEKKQGKKKQNYYYSSLPRNFNYIANITRVMKCCKNNPEPSECEIPVLFCRTLGEIDRSFILNAEIGNYFQQSIVTPYVGLGISKEGYYSRVSILAGTDIDLSFLGILRYQYHFLSFPFSVFNPLSTWQSPTEQQIINRYGRLYLGTELKTRNNENKPNYLEQNIHIGLAIVNTNRNALIQRIFIQYGIGIDYLRNNSKGVYSIIQLGLNIKITQIKINNAT